MVNRTLSEIMRAICAKRMMRRSGFRVRLAAAWCKANGYDYSPAVKDYVERLVQKARDLWRGSNEPKC